MFPEAIDLGTLDRLATVSFPENLKFENSYPHAGDQSCSSMAKALSVTKKAMTSLGQKWACGWW